MCIYGQTGTKKRAAPGSLHAVASARTTEGSSSRAQGVLVERPLLA